VEYLLNKIYLDPVYSLKNLTTFQLNYFYDYFRCECLTKNHISSQECLKDKKEAIKIYKNIKNELKQRLQLGLNYQHIH
jgi:CRISPR/Cas system CSM-associated protein Csm2 small subunit